MKDASIKNLLLAINCMSHNYQIIVDHSVPVITKIASRNSPVFIPISGPDAIGKTTLARRLGDELHDVVIFTTDVYLRNSRDDRVRAAKDGKSGYWLEMHHVDLLFSDLESLKAGKPIKRRVYNSLDGASTEATGYLEPARYVIVDSGLSLTDAFLAVYPPERFGIFLSADEEVRKIIKHRRDMIERNYEELYNRYDRELVEMFIQRNLEDCKTIVMPTAEKADLVAKIDENYKILEMMFQKPRQNL
jgi:uridine kinase